MDADLVINIGISVALTAVFIWMYSDAKQQGSYWTSFWGWMSTLAVLVDCVTVAAVVVVLVLKAFGQA